jgi:tetratricopeptide (TPR) repeat protein
MGRLLAERSELMAARNAFRESASIRELLGDVNGLATTLHNLGSVADRLGQFPEALGHYHRSLRLNRRMGNTSRMAATLMNQGAGYMRCGYYGRARVALEEALDLNEAQKRTWWYAACLGNLGQLWVRVGRLPDAVTCLQESSQLFLDSESWEWRAESLVDLAAARLLVGAFDDAETLLNDAFECSTRYPGSETEARVLILFAQLALARQNIVDARQRIEELEWNDAAQVTPELRVECALLDGHLGLRTGRLQLAQSRLEEANRVAREHDLAPGLWRAKAALSLLQVRQGRSGKGQTEEALRELVARVEDPELMRAVQNSLQLEWRRYGVPTSSLET